MRQGDTCLVGAGAVPVLIGGCNVGAEDFGQEHIKGLMDGFQAIAKLDRTPFMKWSQNSSNSLFGADFTAAASCPFAATMPAPTTN